MTTPPTPHPVSRERSPLLDGAPPVTPETATKVAAVLARARREEAPAA